MSASRESLKHYDERIRFLPKVAAVIHETNAHYKRKLVSEAMLKAVAIQCTGGNFFMCNTCKDNTRLIDWLVAQSKQEPHVVRAAITAQKGDHGMTYARFEVNQPMMDLEHFLPSSAKHQECCRVLLGLNVGAWHYPISQVVSLEEGSTVFDSAVMFISNPFLQCAAVAALFDKLMLEHKMDFTKACYMYAVLVNKFNAHGFSLGCERQYKLLLKQGHTKEV